MSAAAPQDASLTAKAPGKNLSCLNNFSLRLCGKALPFTIPGRSKLYGEVVAVRDISFAIAAGNLVTLLGPSGCGKTTTLRMIAGLELPTSGTIKFGGADVTRVPASERDVSMVFQSYALFPT